MQQLVHCFVCTREIFNTSNSLQSIYNVPTGPPVDWKNPNKKYTAIMKKFPRVILKERKSNQREMLIKKRQIPLPNNPMAKTVVGLNVSPNFPEMMFPAA